MARNITYWYNFLALEKDAQPTIIAELQPEADELKNLRTVLQADNSPSQTTFWRCATWIIAAGYAVVDYFFDQHKTENTFLVKKRGQVGQDFWWIDKAKEFQYGDLVEILTDEYGLKYTGYSTVDEAAKVVKLVAEVKGDVTNILKVANQDTDLTPIPLTDAQRESFRAYTNKVKPFGTTIEIVAAPPDMVLYNMDVQYDAQADEATVYAATWAALEEYHRTLDFAGQISLSKAGDSVRAVASVLDSNVNSAQIKPSGGVYAPFTWQADTFAGYSIVDPASVINLIKII